MKNTIKEKSLLFFLFITLSIQAQYSIEQLYTKGHPKLEATYTDSNNILNKFVGTWEYSNTTIYLRIKFYKVSLVENCPLASSFQKHHYFDELRSYIEYKEKIGNIWITKYNTFLPFGTTQVIKSSCEEKSIHGNFVFDSEIITLHYTEPSISCERKETASLHIGYINETNPKLKWKVDNLGSNQYTGVPCPDGQTMDNSPFIIPRNLILTKIN